MCSVMYAAFKKFATNGDGGIDLSRAYASLIRFFSAQGPLVVRFKERPCFYPRFENSRFGREGHNLALDLVVQFSSGL